MLGNPQVLGDPYLINAYGYKLQHLPYGLLWIIRLFLLFCVVAHIWAAIALKIENKKARPQDYEVNATVQATLASRTMIMSGLIILFFLIFHLLHYTVRVVPGHEYNHSILTSDGVEYPAEVLLVKNGQPVVDAFGKPLYVHNVHDMMIAGFSYPLTSIFYIIGTFLLSMHLSHGVSSMFQSLTQSNTEKSKFLGMASHDLRNPLVSINGLSHFLASGKFGSLSSTQAEMASSIFEASESMLALVNDLFDVALIETGQLSVEINEVDLHQVVKTSINLYRVTAGEKDIEIEFIEKEIPKLVNCDKRQVRRVMDNLLNNAIKFSERGTTIRVILESDNNWVFFRVADEGPGVPVDEFDKLFGSFSKTSVKPTGGESSTGLGLNICKKVMTAHGGDIFAENLPEKGAQFSVQLQKTAVC